MQQVIQHAGTQTRLPLTFFAEQNRQLSDSATDEQRRLDCVCSTLVGLSP